MGVYHKHLFASHHTCLPFLYLHHDIKMLKRVHPTAVFQLVLLSFVILIISGKVRPLKHLSDTSCSWRSLSWLSNKKVFKGSHLFFYACVLELSGSFVSVLSTLLSSSLSWSEWFCLRNSHCWPLVEEESHLWRKITRVKGRLE